MHKALIVNNPTADTGMNPGSKPVPHLTLSLSYTHTPSLSTPANSPPNILNLPLLTAHLDFLPLAIALLS